MSLHNNEVPLATVKGMNPSNNGQQRVLVSFILFHSDPVFISDHGEEANVVFFYGGLQVILGLH